MTPIDFSDFINDEDMRREAWRRKIAIDEAGAGAEPNRGHHAIAKLVADGICPAVITQNIDGLHQAVWDPGMKSRRTSRQRHLCHVLGL